MTFNKSKITGTAFAASLALLTPIGAQAALLSPVTSAVVQSGDTELYFAPINGLIGTGPLFTTMFADLETDGALAPTGGAFFTQLGGTSYGGEISQVGFNIIADAAGGDMLQFVIDLTASPFRAGALVTFEGEFGTDNSSPFGGDFFDADARYTLAPIVSSTIPLPSGLPLIMGGLVSMALVARRKNKRAE